MRQEARRHFRADEGIVVQVTETGQVVYRELTFVDEATSWSTF